MTTTVNIRTFQDIIEEVLRRGKIASGISSASSEELTTIKGYINNRYTQEIAPMKKWRWREQSRSITTIPVYTTGTVAVTQDQRRVTLSAAATVTSNFKGRYFKVDGDDEYYEIISVSSTSNRTLELSSPYVGTTDATATYKIFKNRYGLWPDFSDIYNIKVVGKTLGDFPYLVNTGDIDELLTQQGITTGSYPTHATIGDVLEYDGPDMGANFIMGYDFMGVPETNNLVLFPMILPQLILDIKYGIQVQPLVELTEEPLLPRDDRIILVYGALADWYSTQRNETSQAIYTRLYTQKLGELEGDFDLTNTTASLIPTNKYRRYKTNRIIQFVSTD